MIIFETIQNHFRVLGISEYPLKRKFHNFNTIHKVLVSVMLLFIAIPLLCYIISEAETVDEFAEPLGIFAAFLVSTTGYWIILRNKADMIELLTALCEIIQRRNENPRLKRLYRTTNQTNEKWTKTFSNWNIRVALPAFVAPNVFLSLFRYFITDQGSESYTLIVPVTLPYNWRSLAPFVATVSVQCVSFYFIVVSFCVILFFYVGLCTFSMAFAADIKICLESLDDEIIYSRGKFTREQQINWETEFHDIIQFHADAIQFVERFFEAYRSIISIALVVMTPLICGCLLQMDSSIAAGNYFRFIRYLDITMTSVLWVFLFCYFGDEVTERFLGISNMISKCAWYLYPIELRKDLLLMMMVAQKPIYSRGFANVQCTRETFKQIINVAYSFFMVLRSFNQ